MILSVVPIVRAPPPELLLLLPEQPASTKAVAATAADMASRRLPLMCADLISVYLFLVWDRDGAQNSAALPNRVDIS